MENQIGVGDRNAQQIGQSPVSQSSTISGNKNKEVILAFVIVLFSFFLIGIFVFLYLKDIESRKIPSSWSTYKNSYYGYSFRYGPEVIAEPDIYGSKESEDLGVELHRLDKEKLKTMGIKDQDQYLRANDFHRGVLLDSSYDKWNVQITKPVLNSKNGDTCKRNKTNGGLTYYECVKNNQAWTFTIYLTSQSTDNAYLTIQFSQPRNSFSQEDRLTIKRIVNSFSKESQMTVMTYPTKSDLFQWIKTYWCDGKNKLYEEYANGLKQYSRYSILSLKKVMDTVYLTKPRSFCEVPIDSMPFLPLESCPFPDATQIFDNHALGESKQYSVCGDTPPSDSYENSNQGMTSLLQKEISKVSAPKGWKYIIMNNVGVAVAFPTTWKVQESPIGSCNPKMSCNSEFIEFRDPDMQVLLTLTQGRMLTKNGAVEEIANLGEIECGAYAECELIREKNSDNGQYEYYLLLIGQPNVIAIPNRITVKFFNNENQTTLLSQTDKIVQSMIFLYEHEIND